MPINTSRHLRPCRLMCAVASLVLFLGWCAIAAAQSQPAPGAVLLRHVPVEHNAVVFLKPAQVMASPLYAHLKADPNFRPVHRQIAALEAATGLNARRDIAEILWSGVMTQPEQRFVVQARGRFDQAALIKRFKAAPNYQTATFKDRPIHAWLNPQNGRTINAAFLANDLIIVSDSPTTIRHAINAGADNAASIQKFTQTRALASRLSPQSAIWFLALRSGVMPPEVYQNPMLNNLQGLVCDARLADRIDMNIHGELPDAQSAQQYRIMIEGMLAMTRLMGDEPILQTLASRAAVSQGGKGVGVRLTATNAEALALLRNAMQASAE